ncbi:undecaprenyl/decaprenyl-phosphate alpha-N-acetylglucosaminyl 1-phosphate transferase [Salinibacterium hongtaonis]|uniref:Undecaprenyl/decaprenyl-phosphate alpha-N-acetylglucosaminyl 1-phosphate transferase n=1 Tax=Homoserinimonas hongtaonis TaxID=2079791 RepID=A0A2U1SX54_9MICO|nr:MraY family glycosyltransferase [Salinibacterium hongtaonis]AWB88820.1 undecaprenyl-phosphate alpha-N-acetylglucosaminyl 1-phosphate transferase [Salinibacterium hongtaonis]PWB96221.1 undecaprenyl/decaprenyl-phosphate alpha-N-acetylglucosaminyl 1-phosphate transferase [Salinibacterium hongtaonis]
MRIVFYVLVGGVSALVTFVLSFIILKLSHRFKLYPGIRERDVHTTPTPRLGGIAMFFGVIVAFAVASQLDRFHLIFANPRPVLALLGAAFVIVALGVADDIWDLDWMTKLTGQILAAGLLVWQGVQLVTVPIGGITIIPPVTGLVITVLAVVLVMNAVNFIDGLDGLVAGVALIASSVFFIYTYILSNGVGESEYFNLASLITAVLAGACIGFLPLNWHPAKMFMGDSGALLVGLLMAASAISVTGQVDPGALASGRQLLPAFIPILLPFAILIVPLLDFALAVFRRLRAGKSPFSADRQHLHHRLLDMGHSHFHAVLIFYSWTAVVAIGCLLFMLVPAWVAIAFVSLGFVLSAWFTLAPLTRRKRIEARVQLAKPGSDSVIDPRLDPLDEASNVREPGDPATVDAALRPKEAP